MTVEELKKQQSEMPDSQLLELVKKQITKLAETGGKSHRMTVPPRLDDTDMLFSELVRRYEQLSAYASQQREEGIREGFEAARVFVADEGRHCGDLYPTVNDYLNSK